MKPSQPVQDPFVYWPSLLMYLKKRGDVAYIMSISMKDMPSHDHDRVCVHEATVMYRKMGKQVKAKTIYPGHIEECTWID